MQKAIEIRIAQVKSLFDMCVENGINPPFTLADFESGVQELRDMGSSETDLNRYVLTHHKFVHELLYTPPRRS